MILPGATLGVLGGGQLGRMFVAAARTMGYRTVVFDPGADSPAGCSADLHLCAGYDDEAALAQLARDCDAVTLEFENVPVPVVEHLQRETCISPAPEALGIAQDRIAEKQFLRGLGLATVPFAVIHAHDDLPAAFEQMAAPLVLKAARFGYDGKGQVLVSDLEEARAAFDAMGGSACLAEQWLELEGELSVVLARSGGGECSFYPVGENEHRRGILHAVSVPARFDDALCETACGQARRLADAMDYCGVLAVEFFVTRSGGLLVNEMAPRPHNSGHYTIDACTASQFVQQVRMMCGLPPGGTQLLAPVVMVNLLGELWGRGAPDWSGLLNEPGLKLHLYGKRDARPGRKMGHFCLLGGPDDASPGDLRIHAEALHRELLERAG